jgi:hypothetical protein
MSTLDGGGGDGGRGDAANPVSTEPEIRFVSADQTFVSRGDGQPPTLAIASTYSGPPAIGRASSDNPWDLYDPISKRHIAVFRLPDDRHALYSVSATLAEEVLFDSLPDVLVDEAPAWGVLSADGRLLYLSTGTAAFVAERKGDTLAFGPARELAFDVGLIHDVSPDRSLVVASGHLPIKWGTPTDIAAPRRISLFEIAADGSLVRDLSAEHPTLTDYVQTPTFMGDSRGLVFEGDDDIDTGDRLFSYRFGDEPVEVFPDALEDQDFNTPCVLSDGRSAFWESKPGEYLLRLFDPVANTTSTVHDEWLPFTGYVRCR